MNGLILGAFSLSTTFVTLINIIVATVIILIIYGIRYLISYIKKVDHLERELTDLKKEYYEKERG
ncbi:hypothetical protein [Staphylococcus gallinarum]|jgi:Tfp pilus assembly protein PilO|uniref:hypothetical protein n=1 Tax=Staphylococcus gallinarum TaxID=1293 RepID=UPI000D1F6BBF|nr:hypothetical protein [Staphylococcus gallinarum]MCD8785748.1 hypothetical protein [Staphylococcus gallinarum]MCD8829051.1 hypothetical protein [Staphylococcus gallinarum]MCD8858458.1 hypothetical protein [Staphylococcus gallinarum]MEB6055802.1 hypothetical protein [Staphylococcus gallinarum]PTK95074.1 hypothetical protein BUZ13_03230 [Staphylococcus gallinarum]